jgi:hypothetical protein
MFLIDYIESFTYRALNQVCAISIQSLVHTHENWDDRLQGYGTQLSKSQEDLQAYLVAMQKRCETLKERIQTLASIPLAPPPSPPAWESRSVFLVRLGRVLFFLYFKFRSDFHDEL